VNPGLWVLASYLVGSIPSSYIAGRLARNIDLRQHGSGNLGATNTFRVLGAKVAAPVMIFDMAKGFVPAGLFAQWDGHDAWGWALAYGAAAILGHVFSIYMRFQGGKGVAIAIVAWLVVLIASKMVSLASITAAVVLIPALLLTESRREVLLMGIAVAAFVIFAHRANIRRIMRGEEHRFGKPRDGQGGSR
jgi:glycerol-3-phosphate acyltransferase PlsY